MSNSRFSEMIKISGGALLAYSYNHWLTNCPSRAIRKAYLKVYLSNLGKKTGVQTGVRVLNGRKVRVGDHVVINWGCVLDGRKFPLEIGNNVSLGPEATILTLGHDPRSQNFADKGGAVKIEDYCWVAYRATVLPGITLAKGTVVGAGSVVSRNTEPFGIYAGVPAKKVGQRPDNLNYKLNFDPWLI